MFKFMQIYTKMPGFRSPATRIGRHVNAFLLKAYYCFNALSKREHLAEGF